MLFRRMGVKPPLTLPKAPTVEHFGPEAMAMQARENMARTLAGRVLARQARGELSRAHLFLGQGPTGAAGAAMARHLANAGVPFGMSLAGTHEKCPPETAGELATLDAMGIMAEELLTEEAAGDMVAGLEEGALCVLAAEARECDGRPREIISAIEEAAGGRESLVVRFDPAFRTPQPDDAVAVFRPQYPPRTREDSRLLDSVAVERFRMSSLALMENAGAAAARECLAMLPGKGAALVVSGKGMNGGDGFVVARHLAWWGVPVRTLLLARADDLYGDALVNLEALEAAGLAAEEITGESRVARIAEEAASIQKAGHAPVIVDAILGTGLTGEPRGVARAAIEAVNSLGLPVLALDCPSGLDTNEGVPLGACITATRTVTFAAAKVGFGRGCGRQFTGEVVVADIGLPAKAYGVVEQ